MKDLDPDGKRLPLPLERRSVLSSALGATIDPEQGEGDESVPPWLESAGR